MSLSVTVNQASGGASVLSVRGEIDASNVDDLRDAISGVLVARRPHVLQVDLGLVTFIDSGGIGQLVAAHRLAAGEGTHLMVTNSSPFVSRQMTIAGVAELLGVPNVDGSGVEIGPLPR